MDQISTSRVHCVDSIPKTTGALIRCCFFRRATIFDPFSTHQDTRIPRSIDVVWIQGVSGNAMARGETVTRRGMGRKSRERSSKSAFLDAVSTSPRLPFSLTPCLYPVCAIPLRFLHLVLAGRPRPRVFPAPHIRPPVSSLLSRRHRYPAGTLANHPSYPNPSGYLHTPLTGLRMFSARTWAESASARNESG